MKRTKPTCLICLARTMYTTLFTTRVTGTTFGLCAPCVQHLALALHHDQPLCRATANEIHARFQEPSDFAN